MANQSIYTVGGTVQAGCGIYLQREADDELLALCRIGTFAYILSTRQIGKSSLMVRTAEQLEKEGIRSVIIDLTQIGTQVSAEGWYLGLVTTISDQLPLETDVIEWWHARAHLGLTQRLTLFMQDVLLKEVTERIVIFVDEIDTTLTLEFTDDFFATVRYFHEARAHVPEFARLSFVLIGVAMPGDLIHNPQRTPFNIGQRVDLTDFTFKEALPLANGLNLPREEAQQVLRWSLKWTNGHPYLTQRLCRALADQKQGNWSEADVDRAVASTFLGKMSEQDHNLQFVRDMLTKRAPDLAGVLSTYHEIRRDQHPVQDEGQSLVKSHLKLSGIVCREGRALRVRNPIYREVFDDQWVKKHLPINWVKRARQAGIFSIAALLVLAAIVASYSAVRANKRLFEANQSLENANRDAQQKIDEAEQKAREINARLDERQGQLDEATQKFKDAEQRLEGAEQDVQKTALEAAEQRQLAESKAQEAEQQRVIFTAYKTAAKAEVLRNQQANSLPQSALLAIESQQRFPSSEARQTLLNGLLLLPRLTNQVSHEASVSAIAFSPDGKYLATASEDHTARVWDIMSGREVRRLPHEDEVNAIAFSTDGKYLATASGSSKSEIRIGGSGGYRLTSFQSPEPSPCQHRTARVWDVRSGQEIACLAHNDIARAIAFSPNGKYIAIGSFDGKARIWEVNSSRESISLVHKEGSVNQVIFSLDGKYLATQSGSEAFVWDLNSGKQIIKVTHDNQGRSYQMNGIAFSPDGNYLATASLDDTARLWQVSTGQEIARITHKGNVNAVAFSPDGQYLATASDDSTARILRVAGSCEVVRLNHYNAVKSIAFSLDGKYLTTASTDNTARVWETVTGREVARATHEDPVNAVAISPDGKYMASRSSSRTPTSFSLYDKTVRLWEVGGGGEALRITHEDNVSAVAFSKDGKYLATGSFDHTARVWELSSGREIHTIHHKDMVIAIAFSPDAKYLATASADKTACIWEMESGREIFCMPHKGEVIKLAFSPDGQFIATASVRDNSARIWAITDHRELNPLLHGDQVTDIAFSPDGTYLATASRDHTARMWEVTTGREISRMKHDDWVTAISFSFDGRYLASASGSSWNLLRGNNEDNTARVWEASSGREIARVKHEGIVWAVAFSPDGKYLATASADSTVGLWSVASGREVLRLRHNTPVGGVAFSPDGKFLATGGGLYTALDRSSVQNNLVRVWDTGTGQAVTQITHEGRVFAFVFSSDGKYLASASADKTARVFRWQPDYLIDEACSRLTRNLTFEEWHEYFGDEPYRKTCTNLPMHPSVIKMGKKLAGESDIQGAVNIFRRAMVLDPSLRFNPETEAQRLAAVAKGDAFLNQVKRLTDEGNVKDAIAAYKAAVSAYLQAQKFGPTPELSAAVIIFNQLCWIGSLGDYSAEVMDACNQAVALDPKDARIRDSRGVARARTGDFKGAIEDFQAFVEQTDDPNKKAERQRWINDLRADKNPFTPDVIRRLHNH